MFILSNSSLLNAAGEENKTNFQFLGGFMIRNISQGVNLIFKIKEMNGNHRLPTVFFSFL